MRKLSPLKSIIPLLILSSTQSKYINVSNSTHGVEYGVDVSWPIHNFNPGQNSDASLTSNPTWSNKKSKSSGKASLRGKIGRALWGESGEGKEDEKEDEKENEKENEEGQERVYIGEGPEEVYRTHMEGCADTYGRAMCEKNEVRETVMRYLG